MSLRKRSKGYLDATPASSVPQSCTEVFKYLPSQLGVNSLPLNTYNKQIGPK